MRILSLRIDDASVLVMGFGVKAKGFIRQTHGISSTHAMDQGLAFPCCSVRLLSVLDVSSPVREKVLAWKVASSTI